MTQRTGGPAFLARLRRTRPIDPVVLDELTAIVDRRAPLGADARSRRARPTTRPLTPADRAAVQDLAMRCSAETLRRRFHAPVSHLRAERVAELLLGDGPAARRPLSSVLAEVDGVVIGVGTLHRNVVGDGEMAVLVEDAWHGTGVGSRLTAALFHQAADRGLHHIVADVLAEPRYLVESLQRHNRSAAVAFDGPVATIRMPVAAA
jgi:GNAT superfamily N-acetyltransferase